MSARELLVILAICVTWGFHFVVMKVATDAVPPIFYAALRMTLVAVILCPFLRWRSGRMLPVLIAGACLGGVNYALTFTGVRLATASSIAVAVELYVPFATILSVVFLGEKVGWRRSSGIALAFLGVAIIALGKNGDAAAEARIGLGVGLAVAGAFIEATGAVLVKRAAGFRPHELLAWFAVVGSVILWGCTLAIEDGQGASLRDGDPLLIAGAVVYSALAASIFAHTAYYWLLQRLPVSQVAPSALVTTLLAVAFGVLLLGDPLTLRFFFGGVLALTGVAVILFRSSGRTIIEPGAPEPVVVAHAISDPPARTLEKQP